MAGEALTSPGPFLLTQNAVFSNSMLCADVSQGGKSGIGRRGASGQKYGPA
jgi:hypothetical protein